jgi:hypothetical protein
VTDDVSFYEFMSALASAEVDGVCKRYSVDEAGPRSVQTAQMPCQWVQIQGIGAQSSVEEPLMANQTRGSRRHRGAVVVALGPVAQGLDGANLVAAYRMVDAVYDAVAVVADDLGRSYPTVEVYLTPDLKIGDVGCWAVVANVGVLA